MRTTGGREFSDFLTHYQFTTQAKDKPMKHMRTIAVLVVLLAVVCSMSLGQLKYIDRFPFPDTTVSKLKFGVINGGLGVDPDGKVWIQPYSISDTMAVDTGNVGISPIYVFNSNGTPASFSPIMILTGPNESEVTVTDTIFGRYANALPATGRLGYGGGIDPSSGNFIAVWGTRTPEPGALVWEIDYKTGQGVRRRLNPTGLTTNSPASVAVNNDGEIFVCGVLGALPGLVLNANMTDNNQFATSVPAIGRTIAVSGDGNDVYVPRFTALKTYVYHSANGSLGPYTLQDSVLNGMSTEAIAIHPVTGHLWVTADRRSLKDTIDLNRQWSFNMIYVYDPVGVAIVDSVDLKVDSHGNPLWSTGAAGPLPRGMAFSAGGDTLYVAHFDSSATPAIRRIIKTDISSVTKTGGVPTGFELEQNFPNPFNPTTEIRFSITAAGKTTLIVYDMLGRVVRGLVNGNLAPGNYSANFNAGDLSSGMYIYVLTSGDGRLTKKMVLMK